jgi:hypothetical protein
MVKEMMVVQEIVDQEATTQQVAAAVLEESVQLQQVVPRLEMVEREYSIPLAEQLYAMQAVVEAVLETASVEQE